MDHVILGFTPKDNRNYEVRKHIGEDVLFIQDEKTALFLKNKLMFPLLSHA